MRQQRLEYVQNAVLQGCCGRRRSEFMGGIGVVLQLNLLGVSGELQLNTPCMRSRGRGCAQSVESKVFWCGNTIMKLVKSEETFVIGATPCLGWLEIDQKS
jgi:hypothetical protein